MANKLLGVIRVHKLGGCIKTEMGALRRDKNNAKNKMWNKKTNHWFTNNQTNEKKN